MSQELLSGLILLLSMFLMPLVLVVMLGWFNKLDQKIAKKLLKNKYNPNKQYTVIQNEVDGIVVMEKE